MRFLDLLEPDRVLAPLEVPTVEEAAFRLLALVPESARLSVQTREKVARELARGTRGELIYLQRSVVAIFAEQEGLTGPTVLVGAAPEPFSVLVEGKDDPDQARVLFLFLVPGKATATRARLAPTLRSWLSEEGVAEALADADSPGAVLTAPGLEQVSFPEHAQVSEALEPARYRVYPESPAGELLDLMIRRRLPAVPVVGEGYEVLGVVTAEDALRYVLASEGAAAGEEPVVRDIMTRQVLCVSEDQDLRDVAQLMVSRGATQLPVVREGQFVGFVTRDSALAALAGVADEGPD
ncbi:MAG: CBS domain-containing protein [Gemmatimonadota bacterium]